MRRGNARRIKEFNGLRRYLTGSMPPKASQGRRRRTAPRKKPDAIEIVVRRGAIRRFDALKTRTSELPVVVTWDRRTNQRRDDPEATSAKRDRQQAERRRKPPFTWDLADFVVVEPVKRRKVSRKKSTRK
jgi:hypothetical protein